MGTQTERRKFDPMDYSWFKPEFLGMLLQNLIWKPRAFGAKENIVRPVQTFEAIMVRMKFLILTAHLFREEAFADPWDVCFLVSPNKLCFCSNRFLFLSLQL